MVSEILLVCQACDTDMEKILTEYEESVALKFHIIKKDIYRCKICKSIIEHHEIVKNSCGEHSP